jgi:hypothetical protein
MKLNFKECGVNRSIRTPNFEEYIVFTREGESESRDIGFLHVLYESNEVSKMWAFFEVEIENSEEETNEFLDNLRFRLELKSKPMDITISFIKETYVVRFE